MISKLPDLLIRYFQDYGIQQKFSKNQTICTEGESAKFVYFVVEGCVAISKETASGKELTIRLASGGNCIGENIVFMPIQSYPISAKTIENTTVLSLSKEKLEQLLQQENATLISYMQWLQVQTMREQSKIRDLVLHGKKGALFSTLIRLSNTYGKENAEHQIVIHQHLTNSDLANLCGTSREVVNRLLQELKRESIISEKFGYIIIHDLDYLKNICECDNCPIAICQIN